MKEIQEKLPSISSTLLNCCFSTKGRQLVLRKEKAISCKCLLRNLSIILGVIPAFCGFLFNGFYVKVELIPCSFMSKQNGKLIVAK